MRKPELLSVVQKVEAALTLLKQEGRFSEITVIGVCKLADVNRSNLYERHPEMLQEIEKAGHKPEPRIRSPEKSTESLIVELRLVKRQYKALLRLALEQQAEIVSLRSRATTARRPKNGPPV